MYKKTNLRTVREPTSQCPRDTPSTRNAAHRSMTPAARKITSNRRERAPHRRTGSQKKQRRPTQEFTQQLREELGGRKVSEKRIVKGKVISKKKSNSGGNVGKFIAHRLHQQPTPRDHIQEKSGMEKRGAKKELEGKILTKGKLDAN